MTISQKLLTPIAILALTLTACGDGQADGDPGATSPSSDEARIVLEDTSYVPARISAAPGATVTFVHQDGGIPHTVTAESGAFDSGRMADGDTFTVTPEESDEITFFCEIHPTQMRGTIEVSDT